MKTYMIFTRKNFTRNATVRDVSDVKFIKLGFRFPYSIEFFNAFYAMSRGQYYFSLIIATLTAASIMLGQVLLFGMLSFCFGIIASDVEIFFLKLKKYRLCASITAKNEAEAKLQFFASKF